MPAIHSHPIQSISYGTVLGLILFILFIALLVVVFYFLFADQIVNIYCLATGSESCFCPNAPPCCADDLCDLVEAKEENSQAYCANDPCFDVCIEPGDPNNISSPGVGQLNACANCLTFKDKCGFTNAQCNVLCLPLIPQP